jgi:hypothetical protein
MEQHVLAAGPLLDENGNLAEKGYAFAPVKIYDRAKIKAPKIRIKEWDYYYVGNKERGLALTIADNGYMGLATAVVFDFRKPSYVEKSRIRLLTMGSLHLPTSSTEGDAIFSDGRATMRFTHEGKNRRLYCLWPDFAGKGKQLRVDMFLEETNDGKSLAIATPFAQKRHFYYNQKINGLRSTGYAKIGDDFLDFNKESYGVLDWGRGVWPYRSRWFWSSLNAVTAEGDRIGWNLGYGFGDASAATENVFYLNGVAYKLDDVRFDIPMDDWGRDKYMEPWTFRSQNRDIQLIFTPIIDRRSDMNILFLRSKQNQVFGTFNGIIRIPGTAKTAAIVDLLGFAEKVINRW